jgi:triacylglycerol lipase
MTPYDYALIASEAYSADPDIGEEDTASRAIVRTTPDGLCIAFPGTNNLASWIADLDAHMVYVDNIGHVHHGFWNAWLAISAKVLDTIGDQPVTLVGHSLGAAIAIMAAAMLTAAGKPPIAVYGFEPPRVSSDMSIRTLLANVPVHLYRNGNDIVPTVPWGCYHAALLIGIGKPLLPIPNVSDHLMQRVLLALNTGTA